MLKEVHGKYVGMLGEDHPSTINALINLGTASWDCGKYEESLEYYEKALKVREEQSSKESMNYAIILSMAAGSYRELKEYEKAYDYLKQAYTTIATINKGEENLACGMILNSMGMLFKRWRKFDRALDSYERSLNIRLEFLGDKHPEVIASRHNIGELYIEMGNTEKAEEYLT